MNMNKNLIKCLDEAEDRLGILKFIKKGIKGNGVKIGILGYEKDAWHNGGWQIARNTDLEVYEYDVFTDLNYDEAMRKALEDGVDVLISATRKFSWSDKDELMSEKLYNSGIIMIDSADNNGEEVDGYPALSKWWFVCGADAGYSNYGDKVDFVCPTDLVNLNKNGDYVPITHTSGTIPLAGKIAGLLKSLYGKEFDSYSFARYIKNNCADLREEGKDVYTGYGELRLNYEEVKPMKIELVIDDKTVITNGVEEELDVAPKIENDRTLVPLRFIVEKFGCEVDWDEELRKITIIK